MAGEEAVIRSPRSMVTIEWTADARASKGDIITAVSLWGIVLEDVRRGDTVAVCIDCDLIEMKKFEGTEGETAWKAGHRIALSGGPNARKFADADREDPRPRHPEILGFVHKDTATTDTRIEIVWRHS